MQSMTGVGIGKATRDGWEVSAELKTVNHRFLDVNLWPQVSGGDMSRFT